jgi:hypothetical protein
MKDINDIEIEREDLNYKGSKGKILTDIETAILIHKVVNSNHNENLKFTELPEVHSKDIGLVALAEFGGGINMEEREDYWEKNIKYWHINYDSIIDCIKNYVIEKENK